MTGAAERVSRRVSRAVTGLALAAGLVVGCTPAPEDGGRAGTGEGPGHRPQTLALTPEQELSLGQQAYRQILSKSRVVKDGPQVERARDVARKIVKAAGIEPLQREINYRLSGYKWEWDVNVLDDKQVNAFCLPGGKIAVFSGLFSVLDREAGLADAELATVLGHEIAHALAHHSNERIASEQYYQRATWAAAGTLGQLDPRHAEMLIKLLGGVSEVRGLKYARAQETEADHIGIFLMTFAGYDPDAAVRFWERMAQAMQGRHPPEILSDHPSDARRVAQIRAWVPNAKAAKKAFDAGRVAPPR